MMHVLKKAAAAAAAACVATASMVATATPASAATYGAQCGSGYTVINKIEFPNNRGTTFLTYNSSNGNNCVVTVRTSPGAAAPMDAFIKLSSSSTWKRDKGNYTTYAGPVYVSAPATCIDWGGTIGTATIESPDHHCG
ncbi:hypothetical protein BDW27_11617 [Nocardiopsis sp. L17-MgMaSL7]|nr:spore-associated protein A [Nocardiopsis sp. L17-MgMaSL7]PWV45683.1 hypothetical protein BDW27_11617 [Nocardiopsis sp. L17-MgMaSL7]